MVFLVVVVAALGGILVAAALVDRASRRHGHRLRGGGSMWEEEVREHRRDVRAGDAQHYMNPDRAWTRRQRRG
jgi:hypothetical protein